VTSPRSPRLGEVRGSDGYPNDCVRRINFICQTRSNLISILVHSIKERSAVLRRPSNAPAAKELELSIRTNELIAIRSQEPIQHVPKVQLLSPAKAILRYVVKHAFDEIGRCKSIADDPFFDHRVSQILEYAGCVLELRICILVFCRAVFAVPLWKVLDAVAAARRPEADAVYIRW